MAIRPYEISLWTHSDRFLSVLVTSETSKLGQGYEPHWYDGINGEKKLTFTIPIRYFDLETGKMVNNELWYNSLRKSHTLANEKKVKLIFDKLQKKSNQYIHKIHEFIIEDLTEERNENELVCRVTCVGAAFKELGKVGTELLLNVDTMALEEEKENIVIKPTIGYWLDKVFPPPPPGSTKIFWTYQIDVANSFNMPRTRLYEKDMVEDWEVVGSVLSPVYATAPIEKGRFIDVANSNRYNITQDIAEAFQVFVTYEYLYGDSTQPFRVTGKRVLFYDGLLSSSEYSITYGNNETGLTRTSNSVDVTTKMFVENIESDRADDGFVSIAKAQNNPNRDNFVLNFDYFIQSEQLNSVQIAAIPVFERDLRAINLPLGQKNEELASLEYGITILEADINNLNNKYNSQNDNVLDIDEKLTAYNTKLPTYVVVDKDVLNTAKQSGSQIVCTPRRSGVLSSGFIVKKTDNTIIPGNHYSFTTDRYGYVIGVVFTPASEIEDGRLLKLTYNYDLLSFYRNQRATAIMIRDSIKSTLQSKEKQLGIANAKKESLNNTIKTLTTNKENLIANFNALMSPFLKEGTWSNSTHSPSYESKALQSIPITYDPFPLLGEAESSYVVEINPVYYNYILAPTSGITANQIERMSIVESFVEAGINTTRELKYGAQYTPQLIYLQRVHPTRKYATLMALQADSTRPAGYAFFVEANNKVYYDPGSGWTIMTPVLAFVLSRDTRVTGDGRSFAIHTNAIAGNTVIPIPAGNIFSNVPFTIAHRRWILTENGMVGGAPYKNFQANSLILTQGGQRLLEFDDYNVTHDGTLKSITLKINNKVAHSITQFSADFKLDVSSEQLYRDALEVSHTSAYPEVSYEVSFVYINQALNPAIAEDLNFDKTLQLGNIVRITDPEMQIKGLRGIVTGIDMNLDRPEENTFTIQNYKTKFEDLFARIVASSEQMKTSGYLYDRVAGAFNPNMTLSSNILQQTLDSANLTMTSGMKNGVSFGAHGILTETAEPYPNGVKGQTWIAGGSILLSNQLNAEGSRLWTTALSPLGISASAIQTGRLDTGLVNIYSGDQLRFTWKADGLFAYRHDNSGIALRDTYVRYNEDGLLFLDKGQRAVELGWDGLYIGSQDGSVELTGDGGLEVYNAETPRKLLIKLGGFGDKSLTGYYSDYGMKFYKTVNGVHRETLVSTNDGELWLRDSLLVGEDNNMPQVGITGAGKPSPVEDPIRIWAGNATSNLAPFYVTHGGYLRATRASIEGRIDARSGHIGNWSIADAPGYIGAITDASRTVGLSPTGTVFWSGGIRPPMIYMNSIAYKVGERVLYDNIYYRNIQDSAGISPPNPTHWVVETGSIATYYVTSGGNLVATRATIQGHIEATSGSFIGTITAGSGKIGGWNIDTDKLYSDNSMTGMSSAATGLVFWAGGLRTSDPVFAVNATGLLRARDASISGSIYANAGHFAGILSIGAGNQWDENTHYALGDKVVVENQTYEALQANIGRPVTQADYWTLSNPYSYISGNKDSLFSLKIGENFTVTPLGQLWASDGEFTGKITATTGEIGGWQILPLSLHSTSSETGFTIGLSSSGYYRIWASSTVDDEVEYRFYLSHDGRIYALNADVSGKITAESGHIAGVLSIGPNLTTSYIASPTSEQPFGLKINDNFSVTHDGDMSASNAVISGSVTANTGYIGGITGWTIEPNLLHSNDKEVGLYSNQDTTTQGVYSIPGYGTVALWAGGYNGDDPFATPFLVTNQGALYQNSATIRGDIVAKSGYISNEFRVGTRDDGILLKVQYDNNGDYVSSFIGSSRSASGFLGTGWRINNDGEAFFGDVTVRGTIRSSVFEYGKISAVGGMLLVAPTIQTRQPSQSIVEGLDELKNEEFYDISFVNDAEDTRIAGRVWEEGDEVVLDFNQITPSPSDPNLILAEASYSNVRGRIKSIDRDLIIIHALKSQMDLDGRPIMLDLTGAVIESRTQIIFFGREGRRQGLFLNSINDGSYMDVYDEDDVIRENEMPKARLGRLDGIVDSAFGESKLSGYGLYSHNAYLRGQLSLPGVGVTNQEEVTYNYIGENEGLNRAPHDIDQYVAEYMAVGTAPARKQLLEKILNSPIRIWAGPDRNLTTGVVSSDIKTSRFIVTESGFLYATAGIFSGIINATDGIFTGVLKATGLVIDATQDTAYAEPIWDSAGVHPAPDHFYVAYKKNPQVMDDYILDISKFGLSIWEGGLRAYSDYESGWRDNDINAPSGTIAYPYGYHKTNNPNPFPYMSLIDDLNPRLSARSLHIVDVERVTTQHHKFTSLRLQQGQLIFSRGEEDVLNKPSYRQIENIAYNTTGLGWLGVGETDKFIIESGEGGLLINPQQSLPTYVGYLEEDFDIDQVKDPRGVKSTDELNIKGTLHITNFFRKLVTVQGTQEYQTFYRPGVISFQGAEIRTAINATGDEVIGVNFII